jgi:hypothetical protein
VAARNSSKDGSQKRRARSGRPNWILIAALALLILGFLVRRTLGPAALHYLTEPPRVHPGAGNPTQPPGSSIGSLPLSDNPSRASPASNSTPIASAQGEPVESNQSAAVDEKLTDSDRRQLEEILRQKSK